MTTTSPNNGEDADPRNLNSNRQRKKRKTITSDVLKRVRKHLEKNLSNKEIAESEEVSVQTAFNLVRKISEGKTDDEILSAKKGRKKQVYSEIKNKISQMLLRDASYTQAELSEHLEEHDVTITQSGVSRILKDMDYTRKRLVRVPEERNSASTLNSRQSYARELEFISERNLVFLDETGMNLHHTRHYGYSPKNVKAIKVVKGGKGTNISSMVAINHLGILCFEIKTGSFDGESFKSFIQEKLAVHFRNNPNDILIMDNCSFHHRRDVIELLNVNSINHRFLPPYSPHLNPIEEYFSHFKAVLASIHPLPENRTELIQRMTNILSTETISFDGWFLNMRRYIEKALARQIFN